MRRDPIRWYEYAETRTTGVIYFGDDVSQSRNNFSS